VVPGYPPHRTHVYQCLDVVCFAPLKLVFGKKRDKHLRETGEAITPENFLKVYGEAHLKVLTPNLIKIAFHKVGIVPFNHDVVTPQMMAPSCNTSYEVFTPVIPSTPVHIVSDLLVDAVQPGINMRRMQETKSSAMIISPSRPVRTALPLLASTDVGYLTSESPIGSSSQPPDMPTFEISPVKHHAKAAATRAQPTQIDDLTQALEVANAQLDMMKGQVLQLQATMVLQCVYCSRVQ
jgi:hypothetical protein